MTDIDVQTNRRGQKRMLSGSAMLPARLLVS